jgi:hypothetical protein
MAKGGGVMMKLGMKEKMHRFVLSKGKYPLLTVNEEIMEGLMGQPLKKKETIVFKQ